MLDDGTAGLIAIQKCGGVTVVQDPNDAAYPDMPQSALNNVKIDYCIPAAAIGALLDRLAREHPGKNKPVPADVRIEAEIAERVLGGSIAQMDQLGSAAPYNCPSCGGVLWEMDSQDVQRYRCHTGHSFTSSALLVSQWERIEETLWTALRMFEERKNLLNASANRGKSGQGFYSERARETDVHIERIRSILFAPAEQRSREPGNSH
jgi:two-component system chemotaxis response regulator CheB